MYVVDSVSKSYKHHHALTPLTFTATSGECIVLCGGNGAGKSTLLSLLSGSASLSSGQIRLDDISLEKNRHQYLQRVSFMPDDFHAQGYLKVKEFLSFYAKIRKISKERVEEVLHIVGLKDKQDVLVHQLSKGMKQRLLLGQALLPKSNVILLDEPTNGLDPYWITRFIEIIQQIKREGSIVIFSTHMMDVAAELASRVLFLDSGHVVKVVKNTYKHHQDFTLDLLKWHREAKIVQEG
ncbi:ABC transporter ATP-binding protein [Bacillus sp. CGMCC 1.16541]|uniref:ABC transporter ATP-binding protein n=1 Tax=Bacillus sp. CGMCC 1.16541 TaxID=2185143 RepID=UPI000D7291D7|nr:ABC transporter ATP-binding protein [Bacillus sp. CGMCC 1.16541]